MKLCTHLLIVFFFFLTSLSANNPDESSTFANHLPPVKNKELKIVPEAFQLHPEFGEKRLRNPQFPQSYELIHKRDTHTRVFQNLDGSFTTVASGTPLHYIDENGWWVSYSELDNTTSVESLEVINSCFYPEFQESELTLQIPLDDLIINAYLEWEFEAISGGWTADQRSYAAGTSGQTHVLHGTGNQEGTQLYTLNSSIANGLSLGEITIQFYSARIWGGSGCNATYNYLTYRYVEILHGDFQFGDVEVVINEYSASNRQMLDGFGNYEDWVELYNPTEMAVDLSGFYLSDNPNNPLKWQFPGGIIPAGGHLLIMCSGRDMIAGSIPHTNFKLTQLQPESILLSDPNGDLLEEYLLVTTQNGHSVGRVTSGADEWGIFTSPSPGGFNSGAKERYALWPEFSIPCGFYDATVTLEITTEEPDAVIRYTLNGHEPVASSTQYAGPITISSTTVVRARVFSNDSNILPGFIETGTFFIGEEHTIPVFSFSGEQLPTLFGGAQIEPIGAFEFYDEHGQFIDKSVGDFDKHGNDSWGYPQRGVDFICRDEYGYNDELKHKFFATSNRGKFQRLMVKAAANDNYPFENGGAHIRDQYIQSLSQLSSFEMDERSSTSVIVYVNGQYWGVYDLREKVDDRDFTDFYYDQDEIYKGSPIYVQFLKTWGGTHPKYGGQPAVQAWNDLRNFVNNNNLADPENYEYVISQLDFESFLDYFVYNSVVVSRDWLNYNTGWWRGLNPDGQARRWRYILWDMEAAFGHYTNWTGLPNPTATAPPCQVENLNVGNGHAQTLKKLIEQNEEARYRYVTRYIDLRNTYLSAENMIQVLDSMIAVIEPEMPRQIQRWGGNMNQWQQNVQAIRNFINQRHAAMDDGLKNCYQLHGAYDIVFDVVPEHAGRIKMNSAWLPDFPFDAELYGGIETRLEATGTPPYKFSHWTVNGHTVQPGLDSPLISLYLTQNDVITAHFYNPLQGNDLIHYWHFNDLPPGLLNSVDSDFSAIAPATITYPGAGAGYMERRTHSEEDPVSNLNLQMGQQPDQGAVLRVRNPSDTRELVIEAPTTGYKEIVIAFAATRTSSGATEQEFYYSADNGQSWTIHQQAYSIELLPQWELKVFDLSEVEPLYNNPDAVFKVLFIGDNAGGSSGNNRFDNLTMMGVPVFDELAFFSKPLGALDELGTWGMMPDGSGTPPESFTTDNTTFYLHNRDEFTLSYAWTVTGIGTEIVVGDGQAAANFVVNAPLIARTVVSNLATLTLQHTAIPEIAELKHGSTVVFTGDAQNIPYLNYHHLTFKDINPEFDGHGTINISGNMSFAEQVSMPDARDSNEYDIQFGGNEVQNISTNGNVLRAYNMRFLKTHGGITIDENSTISADNQLTFNIGTEAFFADNGIDIYAGNSVNIDGDPESYLFNGTLILAGTEPGIVKGAGAGNNFNIRRDDNTNAVAALNNLVIKVANTGGQFRLRDGSTDTFILNGDLIVESGADGTLRFYENEVFIAGNFIIQDGFSGSVQTIRTLTFNGGGSPYVQLPFAVHTNELVCDVTSTYMLLAGTIEAIDKLHFVQGKIKTMDQGAVVIGLAGEIIGFGDGNYVEGTIGLRTDNIESLMLEFPLGINGQYLPAILELSHLQNHETLYKISISDQLNALKQTPEYLDYIIEDYMYHISKSGDGEVAHAQLSMPFDYDAIPFSLNLLRIANNDGNGWQNSGGTIVGERIFTDGEIEPNGTFALAKASDIYLADGMLIHYWFIDESLPNDTPLEMVDAFWSLSGTGKLDFHSALSGYPFDPDHPDWRKASLERRNAPTPLNYRSEGNNHIIYQEANMRGLQVKQPFTGDGGENTLIVHMPATGFESLRFAFAARDEGAAEVLLLDYSVADGDPVWTTDGLDQSVFQLHDQYALYQIDFSDIESVNQNPHFRIRIRFDGADMLADEGKRVTFNNISLDGQPVGSEFQLISLRQGWSGISSYIEPDISDLETLIAPVFNQFVIMKNNGGLYWPDGGMNTLDEWDSYLGYAVKIHEHSQIAMMGEPLSLTVADLDGGWSYLPVLRNCEYSVNDLFDPLSGNFVIAKEVAGDRIFWPQMGINTLGYLLPGSAYFVLLNHPAALDFPACQDGAYGASLNAALYTSGEGMNHPSPWNPVNNTAISHIVALPDQAAAELLPGDLIGAFTQSGLCAGMTTFSGVTTSIAIYGDDMTTLAVDGFTENEPMYFRMFRPDDQSEYFIDVTYSLSAPDYNGLFVYHGLSVIDDLSLTPTGIGAGVAAGLSVYPNPSAGLFNVSLGQITARVDYRVVNLKGVIVSTGTLSSPVVINLTGQPKGIYFLITDSVGLPPKKLIVN